MADKIYLGQPLTAREVDSRAFAGAFGEYRADADQPILTTASDTTYWQNAAAPREASLSFWTTGTANRFFAPDNMHIIGSLNARLTWVTPPTAGATVRIVIVASYTTPDDWIAECEMPVGTSGSMSMSLAIGDFIPKGEYWEILVYNNTDQNLDFNGKLMVYRVG